MSRTRIVNGTYTKITKKDYNLFSEGNTNINALGKNQFKADNKTVLDSKVKTAANYQPENSVNIYVGMFFDGTGNNRFNSEGLYYTKVNSNEGFIPEKGIKESFEAIVEVNGIPKKVTITDRDSYWNPYSNVVKLHDIYKDVRTPTQDEKSKEYYYILKQYIEGIGTKKGESDDVPGSALGRGDRGILARVAEGIQNVVKEQFSNVSKDKKIYKIVFDVFGFSRGSASARHFCNEVMLPAGYENEMINDPYDKFPIPSGKKILTSPAGGLLGQELKKAGFKSVGDSYHIEIRFLGIFDTVVADPIIKDNLGYKASLLLSPIPILSAIPIISQLFLQEIKTNVSALNIKKVFHITAQNEFRENFALTPSNVGYTLSMVGAHSDIGGGYASLDQYKSILDYFDLKDGQDALYNEKVHLRNYYLSQWISNDESIELKNTYDHYSETIVDPYLGGHLSYVYEKEVKRDPKYQPPRERVYDPNKKHTIDERKLSDHYLLVDTRKISNKYALVPLFLMQQKAIDNGVPFHENPNSARPPVPYSFEYEITDKLLNDYLNEMKEVVKTESSGTYKLPPGMYGELCNKYVHYSANFNGLSSLGLKGGEHSMIASIAYVNQPVALSKDENGSIIFKRGSYAPQ